MASGAVSPGDPLPPIRTVATRLRVSPNTVASAYRLLRERGVVETAGRRGTRVRDRPASTPRERAPLRIPAGVRDLSDGKPAHDLLPDLSEPLRRGALAATGWGYGDPDLSPGLAAAGRRSLAADGVPADRLAVCHSTLDAVERVLTAHLRPGDRVVVEDPAWANLVDLLAAAGLEVVPVPVDDDGPLVEPLRRALVADARAVVVTSRAQVPTGAAVAQPRARALRRVLADHPGTLLVEDDHAAGISGVDAAPLIGATTSWAYIRSVSKAWGPDLRLALVAGDATTIDRLRGRQRLGPGWVSHAVQEAVADLWGSAESVAAVRRAEGCYTERRQALLAALAARGVSAHGRSGVNVWVPVRDELTAVTSLVGEGWAVAPGSRFRLRTGPGLRITIATLLPSEADPLADAVARAVSSGPSPGV